MSHEILDLATLWRSLAMKHFNASRPGFSDTHGEKADLFRKCVERAFYSLAMAMCDKPLRVKSGSGTVRILKVDQDSLRRLMPEAFGTEKSEAIGNQLSDQVSNWLNNSVLEPSALGDAFEGFFGEIPEVVVQSGTRATRDRNTKGVFYTPLTLVEELCAASLTPRLDACDTQESVAAFTVLDPAMGGGSFLLEAAKRIASKLESLGQHDVAYRQALAVTALYGVDRDALAVDVARLALWLAGGAEAKAAEALSRHLVHGDALTGPVGGSKRKVRALHGTDQEDLDWKRAFPEIFDRKEPGFDLVIGNPPWGKVKAEYKRFVTASVEEASRMQGSELRRHVQNHPEGSTRRHGTVEWNDHAMTVKAYAARLKARYSANDGIFGRGDADLYKYFMARCLQLVRGNGAIALIIPAAFRNTEGTSALRNEYLQSGCFTFFTERTNRRRHFPIHSMFRFISFVFERGISGGIKNMTFLDGQKISTPVCIAVDELRAVTGNGLLIPEVRSQSEFELLKRLHRAFLPLEAPGIWSVRFVRELDMTSASSRFLEQKPPKTSHDFLYLPIFEGRMVGQFDYAAKEYIGGAGRTAEWRPLPFGAKKISPHYLLPVKLSDAKLRRYAQPRAAFCDITGHANRRTLLATVLPGGVASGNKVPTCIFEPVDDPRLHLLWVAIANSLVVDWLVRRRISTTLNFFHLYAIPFPRLDPHSAIAKRLIGLAASLSKLDTYPIEFSDWLRNASGQELTAVDDLGTRSAMMDEIDEIAFQLYELDCTEITLIKSDFPHLNRPIPIKRGRKSNPKNDRAPIAA